MDDLLEAMAAACSALGCDSREQVGWCPAWGCWLCAGCRWQRSEREMRIPLADKEALDRAAAVS